MGSRKRTAGLLASRLSVTKTSDTGGNPLNPGDTITYTIVVENTGSVTQHNVTVTDVLPAGVTFEEGSAEKRYPYPDIETDSWTELIRFPGLNTTVTRVFQPTGIPDGATLTQATVVMNGYGRREGGDHGFAWQVSASGVLPGGQEWFTVDRRSFGELGDFYGPWNTVTRSRAWVTGSGPTANGTYSITFADVINSPIVNPDHNNITADVTLQWEKAVRPYRTDSVVNAPEAMVTADHNITLEPGETLTVTFRVTVDEDAEGSLTNTATADSSGSTPASGQVTDTVVPPARFAVSKSTTAAPIVLTPDQTHVDADYTVTVTNTGGRAGTPTAVVDKPSVPAGFTIAQVSVDGTPVAPGAGGTYLLPPGDDLEAGDSRTHQVKVTYAVDQQQVSDWGKLGECDVDTPDETKGLYNRVTMADDSDGTANNDACIPVSATPQFAVSKAAADPDATGGYAPAGGTGAPVKLADDNTATLRYQVRVANTGVAPFKHPAVTDTLTIPAGFTLSELSVGGVAQTPGSSFTIPAATANLAPGATSTYDIVAKVVAANVDATDWAKAAACATDGTGNAASGGFFNLVSMTGDTDGADNNDACVPVTPPTRVFHVEKVGYNCDATVAECALPGAEYTLYDGDPLSGGAIVAGGIQADPGDTTFTSGDLPLGEYYLVESKAPPGFTLLPIPIHLKLTSTGVTLLDDPSGIVTIKDPDGTGVGRFTIVVADTTPAPLPQAGSTGPWPYVGMSLMLMLVAGLYHHLTSGQAAARKRASS